jgi:hypothetical protein
MGVRSSFYSLITSDATLNALVDDRIFPLSIPQDQQTLPAVLFYIEDNEVTQTMSPGIDPDFYYFVVELRSAIYDALDDLAAASDGALRNKRLEGGNGTVIKVLERDIANYDNQGSDDPLFICHCVYKVSRVG